MAIDTIDRQEAVTALALQAIRTTTHVLAATEQTFLAMMRPKEDAPIINRHQRSRVQTFSAIDRTSIPTERMWGGNNRISLVYHHSLSHAKSLSHVAYMLLDAARPIFQNPQIYKTVNTFAYGVEYRIEYREEFRPSTNPKQCDQWSGSIILSEMSADVAHPTYGQLREGDRSEKIQMKLAACQIARLDIHMGMDGTSEISIFVHPLRRGRQNLADYHEKICPKYKGKFAKDEKEYVCPCEQYGLNPEEYRHQRTIGRGIGRGLIAMTPRLIERIAHLHPELPRETTAYIVDSSPFIKKLSMRWTSGQLKTIGFSPYYDHAEEEHMAKRRFVFD